MTQPFGQDAFVQDDLQALYANGKALEIYDDYYLRPFGAREYPAELQVDRQSWKPRKIGSMSMTDLVFQHLPRMHPVGARTEYAKLRIERRLPSPEYDDTQHLLCSVQVRPNSMFANMPNYVVAKVYDPLFYTALNDITLARLDVVAEADRDYAHEVTAYRRFTEVLKKSRHPQSTLIPNFQPRFFGPWFFLAKSLDPNFAGKTRPVRLILTEHIEGLSIAQMCGLAEGNSLVPLNALRQPILDPSVGVKEVIETAEKVKTGGQISHWQRRMFIIDALVDGLSRQVHMGVEVNNISPHQIIVPGGFDAVANAGPYNPAARQNNTRVVVVNYTRSMSGIATAYGALSFEELPLPCSPIDRDGGRRSLGELKGWWPAAWENLPAALGIWPAWFRRCFDTADYMRKEQALPLIEDFDDKNFKIQLEEEKKLPPHRPRTFGDRLELLRERENRGLELLAENRDQSAAPGTTSGGDLGQTSQPQRVLGNITNLPPPSPDSGPRSATGTQPQGVLGNITNRPSSPASGGRRRALGQSPGTQPQGVLGNITNLPSPSPGSGPRSATGIQPHGVLGNITNRPSQGSGSRSSTGTTARTQGQSESGVRENIIPDSESSPSKDEK